MIRSMKVVVLHGIMLVISMNNNLLMTFVGDQVICHIVCIIQLAMSSLEYILYLEILLLCPDTHTLSEGFGLLEFNVSLSQ